MENIFTINDTTANKISFYHFSLFLVALPFDRFYSELVLISLSLHVLVHLKKDLLLRLSDNSILVIAAIVAVNITGILWSPDKTEGFKEVQRQLAIVLLPLIVCVTDLDINRYRKKLLLLFALACSVIILYLYEDALHIILYNHLPLNTLLSGVFINHNFSLPIAMHATYFSMYIALSLVALLAYFPTGGKRWEKWIFVAGLVILSLGLMQLASRAVWISCFICLLLFPFFTPSGYRIKKFLVIGAVSFIAIIAILSNQALKKRYVSELQEDLSTNVSPNDIPEPRALRWHYAWLLIQSKPLYGHGTGSAKKLLDDEYFKHQLYNSYLQQLNSHNQYLSFLLQTGVIGLSVYLFSLVTGLITAIRKKDFLFLSFVILIGVVSFSENILEVNKGIFFFAFFFSCFMPGGKPFLKIKR